MNLEDVKRWRDSIVPAAGNGWPPVDWLIAEVERLSTSQIKAQGEGR